MSDIVKFTVDCEMAARWVPQFLGMLKRMQNLGAVGSSRNVTIMSDGDGDFRPKFEANTYIPSAEGQGKEKLFFDAG